MASANTLPASKYGLRMSSQAMTNREAKSVSEPRTGAPKSDAALPRKSLSEYTGLQARGGTTGVEAPSAISDTAIAQYAAAIVLQGRAIA